MRMAIGLRIVPLLCTILWCTSCEKKAQTSNNVTTLTLDWKPEPEFGGFYQAQLSGAFKQHGLDAQINSAGEGAPMWELVDTGKTPFATTAADQVLIGRDKGADIVAIFAVYQTSPQGIMVHKARGFTTIEDVFTHDGTLAAEDSTWLTYLTGKFPNPRVKLVGYTGGIAPFLARPDYSQQCYVTSEPLQAATEGGDPQTFLIADAGYNPYMTVVICKADLIRTDPARVRAMVLACRDGWRGYLGDPSAANAEMAKLNKEMDPRAFAEAAKAQAPLIETDPAHKTALGTMTLDRWRTLGQQLLDLKKIDHPPTPEACFVDVERLGNGK